MPTLKGNLTPRKSKDPSSRQSPEPCNSPPTETDYLDYMQVVSGHATVHFTIVRHDHLYYFEDANIATVLGYLINQLRMKHDNDRDRQKLVADGLWFKCPAKDIMKHLHLSKHVVPRCLAKLKQKGVIETENRGVPQTMWVKVSAEKLARIARRFLRRGQKPGKRVSENPETGSPETRKAGFYVANKPSDNPPLTRGGVPPAEPANTAPPVPAGDNGHSSNGKGRLTRPSLLDPIINDEATADARLLIKTLRDNGVHINGNGDIRAGSKHLRSLRKKQPEARAVLRWFLNHCGRKEAKSLGLPVINSCLQFTNQYEWIRDRWDEWENGTTKKPARRPGELPEEECW